MKIFAIAFFILLTICSSFAQKGFSITSKDCKNLIGCWEGSLNHSGTIIRKPFATTAELVIRQIGKSRKFEFLNIYTKDPAENLCDTLTISKNGKKLNGFTVISKRRDRKGTVKIITEVAGFDIDNNKPATIRNTYTISMQTYTFTKQIKLKGQAEWSLRQEYKYVRKSCGGNSDENPVNE